MLYLLVDTDGSFIFSLTELSWRPGPQLPSTLYNMESVKLDDGFTVLGGITKDWNNAETIMTIDSNYNWQTYLDKMIIGGRYIAGVKVPPDDFLIC